MNTAAPRPVRLARVLVGLQGSAGVVFAAWLLVAAMRATSGPVPVAATAAWLAGFGILLLIVGVNLEEPMEALAWHGQGYPQRDQRFGCRQAVI